MTEPAELAGPALFDSGAWTWVRDRRFPSLSSWFNAQVVAGRVLMCDLVMLELLRLAPNAARAQQTAELLGSFPCVTMPPAIWASARETQLALAATVDHRRVPPADLLLAAAATIAGVPVVHYDRDYERIAAVTDLDHRWLVPDGTLAQP